MPSEPERAEGERRGIRGVWGGGGGGGEGGGEEEGKRKGKRIKG